MPRGNNSKRLRRCDGWFAYRISVHASQRTGAHWRAGAPLSVRHDKHVRADLLFVASGAPARQAPRETATVRRRNGLCARLCNARQICAAQPQKHSAAQWELVPQLPMPCVEGATYETVGIKGALLYDALGGRSFARRALRIRSICAAETLSEALRRPSLVVSQHLKTTPVMCGRIYGGWCICTSHRHSSGVYACCSQGCCSACAAVGRASGSSASSVSTNAQKSASAPRRRQRRGPRLARSK